ncbi:MAG: bifunctional glycoside hydrolase 114/ polysaccharide deacetylase family protein [Geobacter sp.]|nr:bifunctional glycoside hydrolase 114/ polysaccharide deacetylase family protein [Geobacter sp.]
MLRIPLPLLLALVLFTTLVTSVAAAPTVPFNVAFYYAEKPPLDELQAFDIVVVDPDAVGIQPGKYKTSHSELFAYVSVGEADPQRRFYGQIKPEWLIGDNPAWKSKLVDLANPDWRRFFLDQVVEPLWAAGYRGFFLDTLDSFLLVKDIKKHPALAAGLVDVIRSIKQRHPEARLILNRGFEVLDQVKDVAFAVAAESLFQNFDPVSGSYGQVNESDRTWLLGKFDEVRKTGLPVIAIDYVAPQDRELARKTAAKIKDLGIIPWVTDKDLASLGVGAVEVLPRKILGLYDGDEAPDQIYTAFRRLAVMPFNYLGYKVELHDMRKPLPTGILSGRYAGIVIWPNSDTSGRQQGLLAWVTRQIENGVKVLFLDRFGVYPDQAAGVLGLAYKIPKELPKKLEIIKSSSLLGFELPVLPQLDTFVPITIVTGQAFLSLGAGAFPVSDPVALTPWGGYALSPFVAAEVLSDNYRWVVNPFVFFPRALQLDLQPSPDVTTENGVRLLFAHIDADGFESRVERSGGPLAVTELRERILKKYRVPTTFSVITSALGDRGLNLRQAPVLQAEAREIFKLPWIEAGSHTFSHPFYWQDTEVAKRNYETKYLAIPGYHFDLNTEISGSSQFINKNLLPGGKVVKLLQWSGDCTPGADALAESYKAGLGNINGGATIITKSNNSLTLVAPLGVEKGGYFQVFAPNQNENVYTNDWTGPFYGYRRVIETFQLTDSPRRLKPINIYHHVYSVTKEASRKALEDVYSWALIQKPNAIYTSEYVNKVLDFNRTVVARDSNGWLIRNSGDLRQLRLPISAGYPDLKKSQNVLGFNDHGDSRYVHLGPGGEARLILQQQPPVLPWLQRVGGAVTSFGRTDRKMRFSVRALIPTSITFGAAKGCNLKRQDGGMMKFSQTGEILTAVLAEGAHNLELICGK